MNMKIELGIPRNANALSEVFTVDSFQFREAKMIILDTVELGFVDIENRMNVACTRLTTSFSLWATTKSLSSLLFRLTI